MFRTATNQAALDHLRTIPEFAPVLETVGPFTLKTTRDRFGSLVRAIVSQQISAKAANAIWSRVQAKFEPEKVTAPAILSTPHDDLRSLGLSANKVKSIRDLATKVDDETVPLRRLGRYDDAEVVERLCLVRGIGVWTAQMFLIFSLGRPDVLPTGDLGLRVFVQRLFELDETPSESETASLTAHWAPFRTYATWYGWQFLGV